MIKESELKTNRHNRPIQKSELGINRLYRPIQSEDRIGIRRSINRTFRPPLPISLVFQNIDPPAPIPLSAWRVCPPPATKAGGTHSPGGEGDGGSIFWKTREIGIGLPSYSKICTLWPAVMKPQNVI
jgi:hypothetical protein